MPEWAIVVLAVVVIAVVAVVAYLLMQKRRSDELKERFGPEYDHTVKEIGDRRRAEKELEARREHVERLHIRPLAAEEQNRYSEAWRATQARFVDDPVAAISDADRLVTDVMQTRGYPMRDFEAQAAAISVEHPKMVEHYRRAHRIAEANRGGNADTEELRQAMVHYRALFEDLLGSDVATRTEAA